MIMIIMDRQLVVLDMAIDIIHRVLGMYYNVFCTVIVIYWVLKQSGHGRISR